MLQALLSSIGDSSRWSCPARSESWRGSVVSFWLSRGVFEIGGNGIWNLEISKCRGLSHQQSPRHYNNNVYKCCCCSTRRSPFWSGWNALGGAPEAGGPWLQGAHSPQRLGMDLPVNHPVGIESQNKHLTSDAQEHLWHGHRSGPRLFSCVSWVRLTAKRERRLLFHKAGRLKQGLSSGLPGDMTSFQTTLTLTQITYFIGWGTQPGIYHSWQTQLTPKLNVQTI